MKQMDHRIHVYNRPNFFLKYFFMFWSRGLHVPSVALFGPVLRPITSSSAQTFHDGHRAPTRDAVIIHHVSQHRSMNCHVPITSAAHHFALDPPLGFLNRLATSQMIVLRSPVFSKICLLWSSHHHWPSIINRASVVVATWSFISICAGSST